MRKCLKDMSLKELWQLFPIELVPHKPQWNAWAVEEINILSHMLSTYNPIISHIGSTAIGDIYAKPIIDILIEITSTTDFADIKILMEQHGYICMNVSDNRMSFNKGYTPVGYAEKVFHIHFHITGDNDEICFRDYLLAHPTAAHQYEALKLSILPDYKYDRDGYTNAKTEFIQRIVAIAKRQYNSRHYFKAND